MSVVDFVKAAVLAVVVMAVNVAIAFAVVAAYALVFETGQDQAFYEAAARRIAPWSSVVAGIPLFFGAAYWAARAPARSPVGFALAFWGVYALIDVSVLVRENALVSLAGVFSLSMATKLVAAVAGALRGRQVAAPS